MKELEKLIMALYVYKNNYNLLRFSSPVKEPPVLTAWMGPDPVWTSWRRETSCRCP
jgi:hypothetical protein